MNTGRRKKYFIAPDFQYKVIGLSFIASLTLLAIIYFFNSYYFDYFIQRGQELNLKQGHAYYRLLGEQKDKMDKVFMILGVCITLFVCIFGLFLSHRIAGPLYRLRMYFANEEYAQGKKLSFRKGDFFQDIPKAINEALNK